MALVPIKSAVGWYGRVWQGTTISSVQFYFINLPRLSKLLVCNSKTTCQKNFKGDTYTGINFIL